MSKKNKKPNVIKFSFIQFVHYFCFLWFIDNRANLDIKLKVKFYFHTYID